MINFITINISTLSIWWRDTKYVTQFYFWKETDCTIFLLTQGRNSWENISDMVKMLGQFLNKCTCSIQCIIFYKLMLSIIPQFMKFKYIHPFITGDDSQKKKIHCWYFKIFSFRTTGSFSTKLAQSVLGWILFTGYWGP